MRSVTLTLILGDADNVPDREVEERVVRHLEDTVVRGRWPVAPFVIAGVRDVDVCNEALSG